jgi:hypothetical protein
MIIQHPVVLMFSLNHTTTTHMLHVVTSLERTLLLESEIPQPNLIMRAYKCETEIHCIILGDKSQSESQSIGDSIEVCEFTAANCCVLILLGCYMPGN